jgi:CRP/FNR family transcriptional regulator, cyclic AMP receptor protein
VRRIANDLEIGSTKILCEFGMPNASAVLHTIAEDGLNSLGSSIIRIEKAEMIGLLASESEIATLFRTHLLAANLRLREDFVDVLCGTARQRLARVLLLLAGVGSAGFRGNATIPRISQDILAAMVGTTRSRINFFVREFVRLGYISCNESIEVRSSIRRVFTENR